MNRKMKVSIQLAISLMLCIGTAVTALAQAMPYISYAQGEITLGKGYAYSPSQYFALTPQLDLQEGDAALATCGLSGYVARDVQDLHCCLFVKGSTKDKVIIGWSPLGKDPGSVPCKYEIRLGATEDTEIKRVDIQTGSVLKTTATVLTKVVPGGWTIEGRFPFSEIGLPQAGKRSSLLLAQINTQMIDLNGLSVANTYYLSNCSAGYMALSKPEKWVETKLEMSQPSSNQIIDARQLMRFKELADGAIVEINPLGWHINRKGSNECCMQDDLAICGIRLKWNTPDTTFSSIEDGSIVNSVTGTVERQGKCRTLVVKDIQCFKSIPIPHERTRMFTSRSLRNEPNNTGLMVIMAGRVKQINPGNGCVAELIISDGGEDVSVLLRNESTAKVGDMVTVKGVSWLQSNASNGLELRLSDVIDIIEVKK